MNLGKNIEDGSDFIIDTKSFLSTHTFLQGITGSAKTGALLLMLQELRSEKIREKFGYIPVVIADEQDEFLDVPFTFSDFVVIEKESDYGKLMTVENARKLGESVRQAGSGGRSVILKLSDFKGAKMEEFLAEFITGFRIKDRQYWSPCVFVIDEADIFAPRIGHSKSREPIVDLCRRGRKEGISVILSTQNSYSVHMDARSPCTNRIVGNTAETSHRNACAEMLGLTKDEGKKLWGMKKGEFFIRAEFTDYQLVHVQLNEAIIKPPPIGISRKPKDFVKDSTNALTVKRKPKDISVIDALESKISDLMAENELLRKNQLTESKRKEMIESGYDKGFEACKKLQNDESIEKKFRKVLGI